MKPSVALALAGVSLVLAVWFRVMARTLYSLSLALILITAFAAGLALGLWRKR